MNATNFLELKKKSKTNFSQIYFFLFQRFTCEPSGKQLQTKNPLVLLFNLEFNKRETDLCYNIFVLISRPVIVFIHNSTHFHSVFFIILHSHKIFIVNVSVGEIMGR